MSDTTRFPVYHNVFKGIDFYGTAVSISVKDVQISVRREKDLDDVMIRLPTYDIIMKGKITEVVGDTITFTFDFEETEKESVEALYYYLERFHNWKG